MLDTCSSQGQRHAACGAIGKRGFTQARVDVRLQHAHHGGLLHAVAHAGHRQFTHAAIVLGDGYAAQRLGPVVVVAHLLHQPVQLNAKYKTASVEIPTLSLVGLLNRPGI